MEKNEFGVTVCSPTDIVIMLEHLRCMSVVALQGCDEDGADRIYHAWKDKYELIKTDVDDYFLRMIL